MRKNLLKMLVMSCLILGILCVSDSTALKAAQTQENDDTTFVVGFDAEFPPYGYQDDNGEYVGFDLDLAQEVCNRNGWNLVKQPIDWNTKDMELKSGSIDCIWNGFTMNGRENDYTWSVPYVDNSQVVIVGSDSDIKELKELEGKVVAVQADSSALAAFTGDDATKDNLELASSFADLQEVSDYNSAFMNLEAGAVDAICMDIGVANYEIEARDNKFTMLEEQVSSEQYGIGFKLGNTQLRDMVQTTLFEMLDDGTFEQIAKDWGLEGSICLSREELTTDTTETSVTEEPVAETKQKSKVNWSEKVINIMKQLVSGVKDTLLIFFLTLIFSLPLGLVIAFGRMSKFKPLQFLMKFYISIMRGTPLILQLFVVFFGPYYIFKVHTPSSYRFYAVIIGFTLNYAAYFAEIYRSGIQGIAKGQYEAASVLGYSKTQTFWKIIFPQMCKQVLPPVTNEVITLVKDTSLAFTIAYAEMFTVARRIAAADANIMPLFIAGLFYYVFNFLVAFIMERIEKKLSYY